MITIKIKQPLDDSMGASFRVLTDFLQQINNAENENEFIFDLKEVNFAFPFFLLPVASIINYKKQSGIKVNIELNTNIREYFSYLLFPEGLNSLNNSLWRDKLKTFSFKTYLPICVIPTRTVSSTEREQLLTVFSKILNNQLNLTGNIVSVLSYLLTETIDNITDHANVDNGWLMVQNYPQKGFLDICIVDTGKGILQTYKDFGFTEIDTDIKAMQNAINGRSTKDMKERGFGISTTRRMLVEGLKGKYFLFSGSAFYVWTSQNETITNIQNSFKWKGTMLALRIPKNIPDNFKLYSYLE